MISILIIIFLIVLTIILVKTITFRSKQFKNVKNLQSINLDKKAVINHLSRVIQFKTISFENNLSDQNNEFLELYTYLQNAFPLVHAALKREVFSNYTLFYTWQGKNKELEPILFSGHLDVVPVSEESEKKWIHPPFSGYIDNEYIWGRGTLDDKGPVISVIEAVEQLIKEGFESERTMCFVFTHDEEIGGLNGANTIARMFEAKNIKFKFILDEGGAINSGFIPRISKPIAMIGIAEKGTLNIELTVTQDGGSSATPSKNTSIGILSKAIYKLEKNQCSMTIGGATKEMFDYIGREMNFLNKSAFANLWLFSRLIKSHMSKSQDTASLLRTTTATTMLNGGIKVNVLPTEAKAVISFRIIQGNTISDVLYHIEKTIKDKRIKIKIIGNPVEPSPVSKVNSDEFKVIQKSIHEVFPNVFVTPYLWMGATNSKHFVKFSNNIYRFSPLYINKITSKSIHGIDEKISIDNLIKCIEFYRQLIINSSK